MRWCQKCSMCRQWWTENSEVEEDGVNEDIEMETVEEEGWECGCRQRGGGGEGAEGGGRGKPFGIMYYLPKTPASSWFRLSLWGNSPVWSWPRRRLFTKCMLHENMADMSEGKKKQQLLCTLQFIIWVLIILIEKWSDFLKTVFHAAKIYLLRKYSSNRH